MAPIPQASPLSAEADPLSLSSSSSTATIPVTPITPSTTATLNFPLSSSSPSPTASPLPSTRSPTIPIAIWVPLSALLLVFLIALVLYSARWKTNRLRNERRHAELVREKHSWYRSEMDREEEEGGRNGRARAPSKPPSYGEIFGADGLWRGQGGRERRESEGERGRRWWRR
ncbi:MAG: hypothetical protein Q9208_005705 [Pyrenodesmia sp. 3 TL-2023]